MKIIFTIYFEFESFEADRSEDKGKGFLYILAEASFQPVAGNGHAEIFEIRRLGKG